MKFRSTIASVREGLAAGSRSRVQPASVGDPGGEDPGQCQRQQHPGVQRSTGDGRGTQGEGSAPLRPQFWAVPARS
jgi:hypothetical protein